MAVLGIYVGVINENGYERVGIQTHSTSLLVNTKLARQIARQLNDAANFIDPKMDSREKAWRSLAAAMYQAAGAYNMPVRFLDVLSAASNGESFAHLIDGLLPCDPPDAESKPEGERK